MSETQPPDKTAEMLGFMAQAMGWNITKVDAAQTAMIMYVQANGHSLPESIRRKAAQVVATLYKQALVEALTRVVTGQTLELLMQRAQMNVKDLSVCTNVAESTIRKYLASLSTPREETARKLYNGLVKRAPDAPIGWGELIQLLP